MTLQDLVKKAWQDAGLYVSPSPALKSFLDYFDAASPGCWSEVAAEVRSRCPAEKERLLMPIWGLGERLMRLQLLEALDVSRADEVDLLHKLAKGCDPVKDAFLLQTIAHKDHPDLIESVAEATRKEVPAAAATGHFGALRMLVAMRREQRAG